MNRRKVSVRACFILILMLAMLAGACSQNNPANNAPGNQKATENETKVEVKEGSEVEKVSKYDPPIEITTVRRMRNAAIYEEGQSNDKNIWTDVFEKELGIKLKYNWVTEDDTNSYNTRMNLSVVSGDLPDYYEVNANLFSQLAENGDILDLSELFEQYASPDLKNILSLAGNAMKMATLNGKLMGIPVPTPAMDQSQILWIREDWRKKLNLPEPKTMDDVLAISEAFTTRDPDGNGVDDTFGLALYKDMFSNNGSILGFFNSYHAYRKIWVKDKSGQLVFSSIQPEVKAALTKLAELYKKGEIDKEFSVKDRARVVEDLASGKNGINYASMSSPLTTYQAGYNLNPDIDWRPYPLLSVDNNPARIQIPSDSGAFIVINKKAAHPEAIILLLNKVVDKYVNPVPGEVLFFTPNNYHIYTNITMNLFPVSKGIDNYRAVVKAIDTKDTSTLNAEQLDNHDRISNYLAGKDPTGWSYSKIFYKGGAFSIIEQYLNSDLFHRSEFFGQSLPSMDERWSTLSALEDEVFTAIIMGAKSPDEFDKFVSDWNTLGGEQISKEVNDWYKNK